LTFELFNQGLAQVCIVVYEQDASLVHSCSPVVSAPSSHARRIQA
jgi:hypothetical protein